MVGWGKGGGGTRRERLQACGGVTKQVDATERKALDRYSFLRIALLLA